MLLFYEILLGTILKIFVLLIPFISFFLLSWRYGAVSGRKSYFATISAYLFFVTVHIVSLDYSIVFSRMDDVAQGLPISSAVSLSYLFLFAAGAAIYLGTARLRKHLFSEDLFNWHVYVVLSIFGIVSIIAALLSRSFPIEYSLAPSLYAAAWFLLAAAYLSQTEIYLRLGTKYPRFPIFSAFASIANPVLLLLASKFYSNGSLALEPFYFLRLAAMLISLVAGLLSSVPALFLLSDLIYREALNEGEKKTRLSQFIHAYVFEYSKIIGKVSWALYSQALAGSGRTDFDIDELRASGEKKKLLLEIFGSYQKLTGPLAKKLARDLLSSREEFLSDGAISAAVREFSPG